MMAWLITLAWNVQQHDSITPVAENVDPGVGPGDHIAYLLACADRWLTECPMA